MSNTVMCAIYDKATEAYMRPFQCLTIAQGLRMFEDLFNDPSHDVSRHPEHFSLWKLANFDDQNGEFSPDLICIARGHELAAHKNGDIQ